MTDESRKNTKRERESRNADDQGLRLKRHNSAIAAARSRGGDGDGDTSSK